MQSGERCWKPDLSNFMEMMQAQGCFQVFPLAPLHRISVAGRGDDGFSQEPQNCQFCEKEIALAIKYKREMHLDGGILVSNPIPAEAAIDNEYINKFIDKAIEDAKANNIQGKDTTPFLLKAITDATNNKSLEANIALIYNNAKVGANIAKEYCKVK